jgi:hypothetical protein
VTLPDARSTLYLAPLRSRTARAVAALRARTVSRIPLNPAVVVDPAEATDAFSALALRNVAPAHGSSPKSAVDYGPRLGWSAFTVG